MFEKTLPDLIRGLRSSKKSEEKYVTAAMDEIRSELRKNDLDIKTNAVSKLCLLHMLGYDMSWASFHIVEVMSSPKLSQKRVGYAAAAASFTQSTSVLMLCTNLIKKDLASNNYMDGALAMHALAQIVTPDLGRDLAPDLVALLNHSRPYMRKRAVVTLYRVVLKYPEALRAAYPRLKERLDDSDQSVVGAAVNVICELARKNPKSYLPLAPQLYGLLTSSTNNWMLIKIIKLFAALTPLEPRLVRKLVPPIVNIIQTTPAMSLIYECIHTLIVGGMIVPEGGVGPDGLPESQQDTQVALLCGNKLKMLLENPDQNLKYLALYAFSKMLVVRPNAVGEHREMVLKCLGDADYSIRQRALELISNMANPTNLFGIVKRLLYHLVPKPEPADAAASGSAKTGAKAKAKKKSASLRTEESAYRADVARRILSICAKDTYANVTNFEWYLSVLVDLAYCPGIDVGMGISSQVIDICVRVRDVVPFAVDAMAKLVTDSELLDKAGREPNNSDVLYGAAWVVGEYCEHLADPLDVMDAMLSPRVALLSPATQAVYIHNFLKLYVWWAAGKPSVAASQQKQPPRHLPPFSVDGIPLAVERLQAFTTSADLEVQDRASMVIEILKMVQAEVEAETKTESAAVADDHADAGRLRLDMPGWFAAEVVPVNAKAQRRVGVPDGLDLDAWIHEPVVDADDGYGDGGGGADGAGDGLPDAFYGTGAPVRDSFYEDADRLGARGSAGSGGGARDRRSDPFYLGNADAGVVKSASAVDSVPIVPLSDLLAGGGGGSGSSGAGQPKTGGRGYTSVFAKPSQSARPFLDDPSVLQGPSPTRYTLRSEEAMPPGAAGADTDSDDDGRGGLGGAGRVVDPDAAAVMSIDLSGLDGDTAVGGWAGGSGHGSGDVYVEVLSGSGSGGGSGAKKAKSKKDKSGKSKGDKKGGAESGDKATKKKKSKKSKAGAEQPLVQSEPAAAEQQAQQQQQQQPQQQQGQVEAEPDTPLDAYVSDEMVAHEDDTTTITYTWEHTDMSTRLSPTRSALGVLVRLSIHAPTVPGVYTCTADGHLAVSRVSDTQFTMAATLPIAAAAAPGSGIFTPAASWTAVVTTPAGDTLDVAVGMPAAVNMVSPAHPAVATLTPAGFLAVVGGDVSLPYAVSGQLVLRSSAVFADVVARVARRTGLAVVDVMTEPANAASMYGVTVLGGVVAGLVKERPSAAPGRRKGLVVGIDLRSSVAGLGDAILDDIVALGAELVEQGL